MSYVIVDVESDGPIPAEYSMVCFGAVIFDGLLDTTFYGRTRPIFVSDNLAFDWQFINYYFHRFFGRNPFGFSGRRIGDLYAGMVKDASKASDWKKYRVTKHTHNPVDDAKGNAEALRKLSELGLKI